MLGQLSQHSEILACSALLGVVRLLWQTCTLCHGKFFGFELQLQMQIPSAEYAFPRQKYELYTKWGWRTDEFKVWLMTGHTGQEHIDVESWARREFLLRRRRIRFLLARSLG